MKDEQEPPKGAWLGWSFGMVAVFAGSYSLREGGLFAKTSGWMDKLALILFLPFLAWLVADWMKRDADSGRDSLPDNGVHKHPGDGFAFRLGKSLNRVFRRLRRT